MKKNLIGKLLNKTAVVGIFGLGYVGLPLAIRYAESGYRVLGFDIEVTKVKKLNNGDSYIETITSEEKAYISKVGSATGRDIIPYSSLTRDLEKRGIVVDKGRRPALTSLGKEVLQFLR